MKFELVVLGAHIGVHIKDEISKINNSPILLVEPVPRTLMCSSNLIVTDLPILIYLPICEL